VRVVRGFDQNAPRVAVTALGDAAALLLESARMLARRQS
jgi:hypothetical protein